MYIKLKGKALAQAFHVTSLHSMHFCTCGQKYPTPYDKAKHVTAVKEARKKYPSSPLKNLNGLSN